MAAPAGVVLVVATVGLLGATLGWRLLAPDDPPPWLWGLAFGIGFAAAVLCHIYDAAHDSRPRD